jgi:hypothetical protein
MAEKRLLSSSILRFFRCAHFLGPFGEPANEPPSVWAEEPRIDSGQSIASIRIDRALKSIEGTDEITPIEKAHRNSSPKKFRE